MNTNLNNSPPATTISANVPEASMCIVCRYNIAGLPITGKCPECGTPLQDSLRGFLLRFAPAGYRRRLALGGDLLRGALTLEGVLLIATGLLWVPGLAQLISFGYERYVWAGVGLVAAILAAAGSVALTAPDPKWSAIERRWCARRVTRISAVALLVSEIVSFVMLLAASLGMMLDWAIVDLTTYLILMYAHTALYALSTLGFLVASLRYLGWLFGRVPDQVRERRAKRLAWVLPLVLVLGTVVTMFGPMLFVQIVRRPSFQEIQLAQLVGSIMLGVVRLLIIIIQWRLLGAIRRELVREAAPDSPAGASDLGRLGASPDDK